MDLIFLTASIPHTAQWNPGVGIVMILCNILAIALGKLTMAEPSAEPKLKSSKFFGGMGLSALLATTSLGHVIGFGVILGLANIGIL